jgi:small GTP-binding protein
MDNDNNNEITEVCKVVLLGESGVGKTCIIDRFINDNFDLNQKSSAIPTFTTKTMKFDEFQGKSVKYEIWDTAGQEQYRALNKLFYKDARIAILVYDVTDEKSFEEIQKYWVKQIKENASKDISKKLYYF